MFDGFHLSRARPRGSIPDVRDSEADAPSAPEPYTSSTEPTNDGHVAWVCAHLSSKLAVVQNTLEVEERINQELRNNIFVLEGDVNAAHNRTRRLRSALQRKEAERTLLESQICSLLDDLHSHDREILELKGNVRNAGRAYRRQQDRGDNLQNRVDQLEAVRAREKFLLVESKAEVARLRQEISTHASLAPKSMRTEEEHFRDVLSLNQRVKDLAHQLTRDDRIKHHFVGMGTRKQQRITLQHWLYGILWRDVFDHFLAFLDDAAEDVLTWIGENIQPHHLPFWKATTFSSTESNYNMEAMINRTTKRVIEKLDGNQDMFSNTTMAMLEEIVSLAFQMQFSLGKEGKNIAILYFEEQTLFDPVTMEDVNKRDAGDHTEDASFELIDDGRQLSSARAAPKATRVVTHCVGFGVRGTAGIEHKCSVVTAEVTPGDRRFEGN